MNLTEPLIIRRSAACIPVRSAGHTWDTAAGFFADVTRQRGYGRIERLETALESLRSVAHFLIATHFLDGGVVEFDTEDMKLRLTLVYGRPDASDDLSLPPCEILGAMSPETVFRLTFFISRPILDASLEERIGRRNGAGDLTVRFAQVEALRGETEIPDPACGEDDEFRKEEFEPCP